MDGSHIRFLSETHLDEAGLFGYPIDFEYEVKLDNEVSCSFHLMERNIEGRRVRY